MLPFEGFDLLRFSANITGLNARTKGVKSYIDAVTRISKECFDARVHY
jgi:hypothetical protein